MSRTPTIKVLDNTRLASGYGGWIYCNSCGKNIGYLCYITYDNFRFEYKCKCGGCGSMHIAFEENRLVQDGTQLITIKNRLCCPLDHSPLFTVLEKSLQNYHYEVVCVECNTKYSV